MEVHLFCASTSGFKSRRSYVNVIWGKMSTYFWTSLYNLVSPASNFPFDSLMRKQ